VSKFRFSLAVLFVLLVVSCSSVLAEDFPPPGTTTFRTAVSVFCTVYDNEGLGKDLFLDLAPGTTNLWHGTVGVNEEGYRYIDLLAGSFTVSGIWTYGGEPLGYGHMDVSAMPGRFTSGGYPCGDFPAYGGFQDVVVTLYTPIGTFTNQETLTLGNPALDPVAYQWDRFVVESLNWAHLLGGGPYDTLDWLHIEFEIVPEPSSLIALAGGLIPTLLVVRRRRGKR